jgi:hypothetical protein
MDLPPTLDCTPDAYWPLILTYVLPPVGALLSAIALWVASRARGTSAVALATSLVPPLPLNEERSRPGDNASPRVVRARKK